MVVAELNARARKTLGAGLVLPVMGMMRRDEILAARRHRSTRPGTRPNQERES